MLAAIFALWAYGFYDLTQRFAEWPEADLPEKDALLRDFRCKLAPGMAELGQPFAGSEDVEISRKHNVAIATIGLWYQPIFGKIFEQPKFQGLFIYHLDDIENPVAVKLHASNPHGLSLRELDDDSIRIFVASHDNGKTVGGAEETIIIDYKVSTREAREISRIQHESLYTVNDVKAISNTEYIASNDHFFDHKTPLSGPLSKILQVLRLPLTNVVYVRLSENLQTVLETRTLYRGFHGANGLEYLNGHLYVNDPVGGTVNKLRWSGPRERSAQLVKSLKFRKGFIPDNLSVRSDGKGLIVAGWANAKEVLDKKADKRFLRSLVIGLDFDLEKQTLIHKDYDRKVSASVAADFDGNLFVGAPHRPLNLCNS